MYTNSRKTTNAPSSNSYPSTKAMVSEKNQMASLAWPLRRVSSIGKRTTSGPSSTTESSPNQFFLLVWPRVILMISHTLCLVAITHLKSLAAKKVCKLSRTTKEATNQTWGTGLLTSKTLAMSQNLWKAKIKSKSAIQQLLILVVHLSLFHHKNIKNYRSNGLNR